MSNQTGKLSIVATPIGNLEDITYRAVRTLSECDYVLCEDTRVTGVLLKHYRIGAKLKRYDAHASDAVHERVLADLVAGQHVALVSDAGTPGVSDPGVRLVSQVRAMSEVVIEAIPGPSALTAALSIAGMSGNQFSFLGFVPHKKGRQTFFAGVAEYRHPVIFFESTHRITKTITSISELYPEYVLTIARELTKLHEEVIVGTPAEVLAVLEKEPVKQKGEFVVILHG